MVVGIFRNTKPFTGMLVLLFAFLLWLPALLNPVKQNSANLMPIAKWVYNSLAFNPLYLTVLSVSLICIEAFLLHFILEKHDILTGRSYLPSVVYITLMSCAPLLTQFHPIIPANFFLIWALDPLISLYRNEESYPTVFNISILFALGSLCYLPVVVLFPIIWLGLFIFHPFSLREYLVALVGLFVPFWFVFVYLFWNDRVEQSWFDMVLYPLTHVPRPKPVKKETVYLIVALLLLAALATSKVLEHFGSTSVKTGKVMSFLFWFLILGFFSAFLIPTWTIRDFALMSIPLAVFIGNYLNLARAKWLAEVLFGFLIFTIVWLRISQAN